MAAYAAIKQAEAQNQIIFPQSSQTVHVGTFDANTGNFAFDVQTCDEYYITEQNIGDQPPGGGSVASGGGTTTGTTTKSSGAPTGSGVGGGGKRTILPQATWVPIQTPISLGYVLVYAMDLSLSFSVINPGPTFSVTINGGTTALATGLHAPPVPEGGPQPVPTPSVAVTPAQNMITIPLGAFSTPFQTESIELPGTPVTLQSGSHSAIIRLRVLRPPCATAGAFTMTALPTVVVYAPPPGPDKKNFAAYMSVTAVSNKVSTTISNGNSTKTAAAYSTADFVDKLIGFGTDIANFATSVATLGAGGAAGSAAGGVLGALQSFLGTGGSQGGGGGGGGAANDIKSIASGLKLVQDRVDGLTSSGGQSVTNGLTSTAENDLQTTDTTTLSEGTQTGLGPGIGDRIGIVLNARVAWLILDGELSFTVLGSDGIRAYAVQTLQSDLNLLSSGAPPSTTQTQLDAATIQNLLQLDPLAVPTPTSSLLSPPRFVVNQPPTIGGSGTDPQGDQYSVSHAVASTDSQTTANTTINLTDTKPGWIVGLFDGQNTETQTTLTSTYTSALSLTTTQTITSSVTLFAAADELPNMISVYFDTLFGTFAYLPAGS